MSQDRRPNILYLFTDQQCADAMSCAGNPDVQTPAMDRLAADGVRFDRTYCTFPLCTPSRASMFTGRMPHELKMKRNEIPIDESLREQELGRLLSSAGYECVYGGKWHVPEASLPDDGTHGFRRICDLNDNRLARRCVEFLSTKHDKPFFLVASFDNPHNIWDWGAGKPMPWGRIGDPPAPGDCPNLPANHAIAPFEPRVIREFRRRDSMLNAALSFTEDDWRRYRWVYYRLVEKVDAEIGRILNALRENGLEEDTVVIFSCDHGEQLGAHRMIEKWVMHDEAMRVPLIVRGKGVSNPGRVDSRLVSGGPDLYKTICDYARVDPPEGPAGLSLRPLLEGRDGGAWREFVAAETRFAVWAGIEGRMVRTDGYKYIAYAWGCGPLQEQLFDMQRDPGEMVNLAVQSRSRDVRKRHRDLLSGWCERTTDAFGYQPWYPQRPFAVPGCGAERGGP